MTCSSRWSGLRPAVSLSLALATPLCAGLGSVRSPSSSLCGTSTPSSAACWSTTSAAIKYRNYHFFIGVYPNDAPTIRAVTEQARRHPRIHVATCPHDGPTSKGDCLNWIYQRMKEYEARHNMRFRIVMMHDAEDLIHPESLRLINWFSRRYAMVQVPVLPLATPIGEWTHGLYCDEFAEYQHKDIPVRQHLGGFLPVQRRGHGFRSGGPGTVAATRCGRPFDPTCLTEDYETGYLLHSLGYSQVFVPLRAAKGGPMATREYFPRRFRPLFPSARVGSPGSRCKAGSATAGTPRGLSSTGSGATARGWSEICSRPWPTCSSCTVPPATCASLGHPVPWHLGSHIPTWIRHLPPDLRHRDSAVRRARPFRGAYLWLAFCRGGADTHVLGKPGKFCRHRHRAMGIFEGAHQRPGTGMAKDGPRLSAGAARAGLPTRLGFVLWWMLPQTPE